MALPPGHGVINRLRHLFTDLLGNLAADGLRGSDHGRCDMLERELYQGEEKTGGNETLHVETLMDTDIPKYLGENSDTSLGSSSNAMVCLFVYSRHV